MISAIHVAVRMSMPFAILLLIVSSQIVACDNSASTGNGSAAAQATAPLTGLGRLMGSVSYAGRTVGPSVYVGLFRDTGIEKPSGAPDYASQIKWPDFPVIYSFRRVPPGKYLVTAYLSAGAEHPTGPEVASDPAAPFAHITVTADTTVKQDLTLTGP